jgi:hypothetical protein
MKQLLFLIFLLLSCKLLIAQNPDSIAFDEFKHLSQKELLALYNLDDTAKAMIKKHYFNNGGALIFSPIIFLASYGSGYATVSLINYIRKTDLGGAAGFSFLVIGPLLFVSAGVLLLTTTVGILVASKFHSKKHLYQSIKHYRETHDIDPKTLRKVKRYLKK